MRPEDTSQERPLDCFSCQYFKVTWQPDWPYACAAMGFRSRVLPSVEVFRIDGAHCRSHRPKGKLQDAAPPDSPTIAPRFSRRV